MPADRRASTATQLVAELKRLRHRRRGPRPQRASTATQLVAELKPLLGTFRTDPAAASTATQLVAELKHHDPALGLPMTDSIHGDLARGRIEASGRRSST